VRQANTFALILVWLCANCDRRETTEPTLTPASRTESSERATGVEQATEEIAAARCERELRCDNVGPNETYTSREDCLRSLWIDTYDELSACEDGVERRQLDGCLHEIRTRGCAMIARLDAYAACRLDRLCLD
jgi:hypothetical protein